MKTKPIRKKAARQTFLIEVTRAEFLTLPMPVRRRSLRKQTEVFLRLEKKQRRIEHLLDVLRDRHELIDRLERKRANDKVSDRPR